MKHLSKFTKEDTAFEGWRLAVSRAGKKFVRYFSALELGGMERAESAARAMRDALLADLERHSGKEEEIMGRYRKPADGYPVGLRRARPVRRGKDGQGRGPQGCSVRYTPTAARLMEEMSRQWDLSQGSIISVALYMFMAWSRAAKQEGMDVHSLARYLEKLARDGLPPFGQFASSSRPKD